MCNDPFNKEDYLISDAYVTFRFKIFFKTLIYHMLYFYALGPFLAPILTLFEGKNFVRNMGFMLSLRAMTIH